MHCQGYYAGSTILAEEGRWISARFCTEMARRPGLEPSARNWAIRNDRSRQERTFDPCQAVCPLWVVSTHSS